MPEVPALPAGVPLRLAPEAPLPLLPARVEGAGPYQFVLDTGAVTCVVSEPVARRLGLPTGARLGALAAGGEGGVDLLETRLARLQVGDAVREDLPAAVGDLDGLSRLLGAPVDGVLGQPFLRHFEVMIDYPDSRAEFRDPSVPAEAGGRLAAGWSGFRLAGPELRPLILVEAALDGFGPLAFVLDTGASATLVAPGLAAALHLPEVRREPLGGLAGGGEAGIVRCTTLTVAGASAFGLELAAVGGLLAGLEEHLGALISGIAGHTFLKPYRLHLHYPGRRLRLERPERRG